MKDLKAILNRSHKVKMFVKNNLASMPLEVLNLKANSKQWSILEVIAHLSLIYKLYAPKFEIALSTAREKGAKSTIVKQQSTILGRMSIYSMKPKGRKRRFKMKTFDFFEPDIDSGNGDKTLEEFLKNKAQFDAFVERSKKLDLQNIKVSTALGEKVKFYIPECFDFIMTHEERHMVQIEELNGR